LELKFVGSIIVITKFRRVEQEPQSFIN